MKYSAVPLQRGQFSSKSPQYIMYIPSLTVRVNYGQCFWKIKILGRHTDHPRRVVGSPILILGDPSLQMWRFGQNLNWVILQIVSPGTTPPPPPPPPPKKKRDNLFVFINSTTEIMSIHNFVIILIWTANKQLENYRAGMPAPKFRWIH